MNQRKNICQPPRGQDYNGTKGQILEQQYRDCAVDYKLGKHMAVGTSS
jgi:hypothetical protein